MYSHPHLSAQRAQHVHDSVVCILYLVVFARISRVCVCARTRIYILHIFVETKIAGRRVCDFAQVQIPICVTSA